MRRDTRLVLEQIRHALPLGYRFEDTGAPRGERNSFSIYKGEACVFTSFRLRKVLEFVRSIS